jgi:cardiolipin synthase
VASRTPTAPPSASPHASSQVRAFAEQALSRAAGAPLIGGNSVCVLKDAGENYPAWLAAIAGARYSILFENYIVADDAAGRRFVAALAEKARAGVRVCALYDWMGALGAASRRLWEPLRSAGGEVRCFNPPRLDSPLGWLSRDHRKMIAVDGEVGFVTGLCVSRKWMADPVRGRDAWRDTGIELRGPAVAEVERAFSETWSAAGGPMPTPPLPRSSATAPAGDMAVRVLAAEPNVAALYRLDQLIAVMANRTLWLADAYFVGVAAYVQALRAAARDGVDVRLLVPGGSDIPLVPPLSRAGYRPLLEAGVRVFEWNGSMMHAKTAVADGRWARVGSTNLNLASWLGNYELDVVVEDERFGATMERMFEDDLGRATEIVLASRSRVRATAPRPAVRRGGSASRAAAGAMRLGNSVTAAITNRRVLGPAEAGTIAKMGLVLLALATVAVWWPLAVALPLAVFGTWVALALLARAWRLRRAATTQSPGETVQPAPDPGGPGERR